MNTSVNKKNQQNEHLSDVFMLSIFFFRGVYVVKLFVYRGVHVVFLFFFRGVHLKDLILLHTAVPDKITSVNKKNQQNEYICKQKKSTK
jgi:hypothetical protein